MARKVILKTIIMSLRGSKKLLLVLTILGVTCLIYFFQADNISFWLEDNLWEPCGSKCYDNPQSEDLKERRHKGYVIHTSTCIIPEIPLDHPSIAKYKLKEPAVVECSSKPALTQESGLNLLFYPWKLKRYGFSSLAKVRCFYQGIVRVTQDPKKYDKNCDKVSKLKDRVPIIDEVIAIDEDGIFVTCFRASDKSKKIKNAFYKNVHYFIQPRRAEKKRKDYMKKMASSKHQKRQMSVLIMGTDSVSRANLIRNMPMTYDYLVNQLGAIDMKGFNKVGDNTYPNLIAMLAGMSRDELSKACLPTVDHKYDDCPFVWRNYSDNGYITAFGEDAPWMGMFRFRKSGFVLEPTDYYNDPYFSISDENIGHYGGTYDLNGRMCQGGKLSLSIIHDYSLEIVRSIRDTPTFGLFWPGSLTHDNVIRASVADGPSLKYLKSLDNGEHLGNTVLFFLSDHGARYGDIRTTYAGMLEERLPYLMIVLPKWFKEQYPNVYRNMKINAQRLISPFDIHPTLHDILSQAYANLSNSFTGHHGQSLFKVVPENRTCEDLAIPPNYCTCQSSSNVSIDDNLLLELAKFSVSKLNEDLRSYTACAQLTLSKIQEGRLNIPSEGTKPKRKSTVVKNYRVLFTTEPGGAQLESFVQYSSGSLKLLGEISRINMYRNQSHCILDDTQRKFCYCKDLLETTSQSKLNGARIL